jgi:hypothetical protein
VDDLQCYDSSATTVANEEGIDLGAKMALSEALITDRVDTFLRWESTATRVDTLLQSESTLTGQNAVVDDRLKRWHLCNVLALLYRDASFSQENDRFQKKWKAFDQDANQRKAEYLMAGVPYVRNPVRRPKAPVVNVIAGALAADAYSIAVTRVDGAGRESSLSAQTAVEAPAGNGLTVTANGIAAGETWNVYATDGSGPMCKQNTAALAATATWTMPASGLVQGLRAGDGQRPDGRMKQRRILPRG